LWRKFGLIAKQIREADPCFLRVLRVGIALGPGATQRSPAACFLRWETRFGACAVQPAFDATMVKKRFSQLVKV
jgi:hypothetical protein